MRERDWRAEVASSPDDYFGFGQAMKDAIIIEPGTGLWLIVFAGVVGTVAAFILLVSRPRS